MRLRVIARLMVVESLIALARNRVRSGLAMGINVVAVISSVVVGVVSGLFPAIRASRVDPIVALRTE